MKPSRVVIKWYLRTYLMFVASAAPLAGQTIPVYIQQPLGETEALSAATIAALGLQSLIDYGPFAVAEIPEAATAGFSKQAAALGLTGTLVPAFAEIHVRDFVLPGTAAVAVGLPPDLQLADYPGRVGLYLVQFRGPVRPEWLDGLRAVGARPIQYLAHHTLYASIRRRQLRTPLRWGHQRSRATRPRPALT